MRLVCLLFSFLFLFSSCAFSQIKVVASYYEPFFFKEGNTYKGLDVDIINFILKESVDYKVVPFKDAIAMVANGTADMAAGAIYVTKERWKLFNYTVPYLKTGLVLVVPSRSNVKRERDLYGKRICVKISATGEKRAERLKGKLHWLIVRRMNTKDCFEAVARGDADALYNDYYNSLYMINKFYLGELKIVKGVWGPLLLEKNYIAFPVSKKRKELLFRLDQKIIDLKKEGILNFLVNKWFNVAPVDYQKRIFLRALILGIVIIFFIAFLAFVGLLFYRKKRELSFFRDYMEFLPTAVVVTEKDGKIIFSNREARRLLEEIDWEKLIQNSSSPWIEVKDKKLNDRFFLRMRVPVNGHFCYIFVDLTELKRAQEEREILKEKLITAQKLEGLGRVTYQLAHDFNKVLTEILSSVEISLSKLEERDLEEIKHYLEDIKRKVFSFSDFARRLLAFAREPVKEASFVDVNYIIKETEYILEGILGKTAQIKMELGDVRLAKADPVAIFQIMLNLATNARDALAKLGRPAKDNKVIIRTYMAVADEEDVKDFPWAKPGGFVVIEFSDNGPGIPKPLLNKIFEPFFTTKSEGTGIGLFVVNELLKQMGGFLKVKTKEGRGTSFLIYLPAQ